MTFFVAGVEKRLERLMNVPFCVDRHYVRIPIPKDVQAKINQASGCYICETANAVCVVHHIQPDGEPTEANLVLLCEACHEWIHYCLYKHKGYKHLYKPRW